MENDVRIRKADVSDTEELLRIYDYYVQKTAITFEYDTPSPEEFSDRITDILKKYPYIAAEKDGKIVGYAYVHSFGGRMAYDCSAETTIYLDPELRKSGLGKRLYAAIEDITSRQGILNLYACIAVPHGDEDRYLTRNSADFHEHLGYRLTGTFYKCGNKFGNWYDMVWMEKMIGKHDGSSVPPIIPFNQVLPDIDFSKY
ncbi:phosphinothricin acetyltransferase [Lachnospiraceae bacterium]|nr:phosphinothricin acetyltransferase [Lachnospiraceae bacterium]